MGCRVSLQVHPMPTPDPPNIALQEDDEMEEEENNLEIFTPRLEDFAMDTISMEYNL